MSDATLALAAAYGVLVAAVYIYVGRRVSQRDVSAEAALAQNLFVTWWYALAGTTLLGAVQVALYMGDILPVGLYRVLQQVNLLLLVIALWGLLYYLIYLYTGSRRALVPLTLFYVAFYVALVVLVFSNTPTALTDNGWAVSALPALDLSPLGQWALILALLAPQIGAALALFRLYFRVEGRTQKYRVGLLSVAIMVWFGMAFLASAFGFNDLSWWPPVSRLIGLAAAFTILAAYHPPKWVQRRYEVVPISQEAA